MDANTIADVISQVIGNVGFPIVACCVMFYLYYQISNTIAELTTAIEKIFTLLEHMDGGDSDGTKGN